MRSGLYIILILSAVQFSSVYECAQRLMAQGDTADEAYLICSALEGQ